MEKNYDELERKPKSDGHDKAKTIDVMNIQSHGEIQVYEMMKETHREVQQILADLHQTHAEIIKEAESVRIENDLLRAKIARLEAELKDYRSKTTQLN